jgi:pimeloyl-ACP methyl ester carboxylesterase
MNLFYNQYGESGPPLIVLHGLLGESGNWHTLSRTAFQSVATVYALDQRNHGRSPHTDEMDYAIMADDVHGFIEEHNLDWPTLLGHSMGGKTAMQLALAHPETVERLIVVDMAPKAYPPRHEHLLEALARQHVEGTWLTRIDISGGGTALRLDGRTLASALVPRYVQRLSEEEVMADIAFNYLELQRPPQGSEAPRRREMMFRMSSTRVEDQ